MKQALTVCCLMIYLLGVGCGPELVNSPPIPAVVEKKSYEPPDKDVLLFEEAIKAVEKETSTPFIARPNFLYIHSSLHPELGPYAVGTRKNNMVLIFLDRHEDNERELYDTMCHELMHISLEVRGWNNTFRGVDEDTVRFLGALNEVICWDTANKLANSRFKTTAEVNLQYIPRNPVPPLILYGLWEQNPEIALSVMSDPASASELMRGILRGIASMQQELAQ